MAIKTHDLPSGDVSLTIDGNVHLLSRADQRELLETLARIHGFSLIDHVERKSLLELANEVQEKRGPGGTTDVAYAGIALANAVSHSLRADDPQEV